MPAAKSSVSETIMPSCMSASRIVALLTITRNISTKNALFRTSEEEEEEAICLLLEFFLGVQRAWFLYIYNYMGTLFFCYNFCEEQLKLIFKYLLYIKILFEFV